MARIEGVNLPNDKHVVIGLTAIYGIGRSLSAVICDRAGIARNTRVRDLTDSDQEKLRDQIKASEIKIEGDLRRLVAISIKRLIDLGCYRGVRHRKGLPVNGQRTRTNARTRKGPRRAAASLKK